MAGLSSAKAYTTAAPLPLPPTNTKAAANAPGGAPYWDPKDDLDPLHDPDPKRDARDDRECDPFSGRGWLNTGAVALVCFGIIALFAGYPIIVSTSRSYTRAFTGGYTGSGVNGTGQVPVLPNLPNMIDADTPDSVMTRQGWDGKNYNLVFSDEFNVDGRTFWPGDDPWWEAVDLHYWATADLEWYAPDAVVTQDGAMVITMIEQVTHNLNFRSGMVQSWNKLCFSSGYVEVNVSIPGAPTAPGLWPGVWSMGNLGRAGYGATTEGTWPYSYDSCDVGTYPSQQTKDGVPSASDTSTSGTLSSLPGQKLSSCTCPGSDHPGPNVGTGRGVPEIDILEAQIDPTHWQGQASQSFQVAPFNAFYQWNNQSTTMFDTTQSHYNSYKGGPYQQAISTVSNFPNNCYETNGGWCTFGYEFWGNKDDRNSDGATYITWFINGTPTWTAKNTAVQGDTLSQVSNRLISEEPMYLIFNLGMAYNFQHQDFEHLRFPAHFKIDYVRIYQRDGQTNIGCDPSGHPTTDYISRHAGAYSNPNFTTWAQAGYEFPRNSQYDGC